MTKSGATLTSAQHKVLNDNGTTSFGKTYFQLCQLYSLPVQTHLIHHEPTTLLLDVDKIHKDEDWAPILMALRKSKDLVKISLLSDVKQAKSTSNEAVTRFASGSVKTIVRILPQLMGSLLSSSHLQVLDVSGIQLREAALRVLAKGIGNNSKIRYLSFSRCNIGDSGIFILAPAIRTIKLLRVLNFSGCGLTEKAAHIISSFLKSLAVRRQADNWAHSLRLSPLDTDPSLPFQTYRDAPRPLKRLIMCQNNLGDNGASPLFDLLFEEVGLAALDLQYNNLTNKTATKALQVLKVNRDLVVLDLKFNSINPDSLNKINSYLAVNEKAKHARDPQIDFDLIRFEGKEYLKPLFFDEIAQTRNYKPTVSSVAKLNVPVNERFSHNQRKLLLNARPKVSIGKPRPESEANQKSKKDLLNRIKLQRKRLQDSNSSISVKLSSNKGSLVATKKDDLPLEEMHEIDLVLDALDMYYDTKSLVSTLGKEKNPISSPKRPKSPSADKKVRSKSPHHKEAQKSIPKKDSIISKKEISTKSSTKVKPGDISLAKGIRATLKGETLHKSVKVNPADISPSKGGSTNTSAKVKPENISVSQLVNENMLLKERLGKLESMLQQVLKNGTDAAVESAKPKLPEKGVSFTKIELEPSACVQESIREAMTSLITTQAAVRPHTVRERPNVKENGLLIYKQEAKAFSVLEEIKAEIISVPKNEHARQVPAKEEPQVKVPTKEKSQVKVPKKEIFEPLDVIQIQGMLKKSPESIEDLTRLLEQSVKAFHSMLDELEGKNVTVQ